MINLKHKIGLKLWSTNKNYVETVRNLYEKEYFAYIEIYSVPDSYESSCRIWRQIDVPYTIHAPHFGSGLNLSKRELETSNRQLIEEAKRFADDLHADYIVVHPGVAGDLNETIRQFNLFKDERFVVENKPWLGLRNNLICMGKTIEEVSLIVNQCGIGFCLDVGHAFCAANYLKVNGLDYVKTFIEKVPPTMYHVTDGDYDSVYDSHLHYGEGTFPLTEIFKMIPENAKVTNESRKNSKTNLDDYVGDIDYLLKLQQ